MINVDIYIKHIYRLLPIYEKAQLDNDFSNYLQSINYSIQEILNIEDSTVINPIIRCLTELKQYNNYNHYNVRKVVFFCISRLRTLKS